MNPVQVSFEQLEHVVQPGKVLGVYDFGDDGACRVVFVQPADDCVDKGHGLRHPFFRIGDTQVFIAGEFQEVHAFERNPGQRRLKAVCRAAHGQGPGVNALVRIKHGRVAAVECLA